MPAHHPRLPGLLYSVPLTPQQATVNPHLHWRLLDTHRQVWLSLLWGHCSFLLGPSGHKVLFLPSKSLFPQFCGSSIIKSHWSSKSKSLGFSVPFPDLQVRKSVAGPRTFITVRELLWDNCSPVCGLSARWFYGGAHIPHLPGLLQPEALFPWQATGDPCPAHQSKTQIPPQPVPPIRKLLQASYPHPSEGRQNGNHSHRKPTKLITRITAFSNSMKL